MRLQKCDGGKRKDCPRVETERGSVVGCNICGWFFPERDERLRTQTDIGLPGSESDLSTRESNRPDKVEWDW